MTEHGRDSTINWLALAGEHQMLENFVARFLLLPVGILALGHGASYGADECVSILQYGSTLQQTSDFHTSAQALNNFFCSHRINSENSFKQIQKQYGWDSNLKLWDWFDGTGNAKVGDASTEAKQVTLESALCSSDNLSYRQTDQSSKFLRTVSDAVVRAWSACMKGEGRSGLQLSYILSNSRDYVDIVYRYNLPEGLDQKPQVEQVGPSSSQMNLADCRLPSTGDIIGEENSIRCKREPTRESNFDLKLKNISVQRIRIPASPELALPVADITGGMSSGECDNAKNRKIPYEFTQTGRRVSWTFNTAYFTHGFEGAFINSDTFLGALDRSTATNLSAGSDMIPIGCHVYYQFVVGVKQGQDGRPYIKGDGKVISGDIISNGRVVRRNVPCTSADSGPRCDLVCGRKDPISGAILNPYVPEFCQ